tara:strand:- start:540 stop:803 length:264 start_codon:yes stop_codon:yes gene_type:complete
MKSKNLRLSDHEVILLITSIEHCVSDVHYWNRLNGKVHENSKELATLLVKMWGATSGEIPFPDSLVDFVEEHIPIYIDRIKRKGDSK